MSFSDYKSEYVSKLESVIDVSEKILMINQKYKIFEDSLVEKIQNYDIRNKFYLNKVKNEIIELAIVGLENSGKSSFANAFIEQKDAFPTDSVRCTFTSTELRYGDDIAEVEFFTRDEFNQIFKETLSKVEFPNYQNTNFDTLTLPSFDSYFNSLEDTNPSLHQYHLGKTESDIRDIIEGRDIIKSLLNTSIKKFTKNEINSNELRNFITDKYKSRAVKKVLIKSQKLADMQNMVIYDVPGFDSTTKKHEEETILKLRSADVILLIKNVDDKPNITGPEINTLKKESDDDGIKLNQKLFIFGNKIDKANSKEVAIKNIDTLIEESTKKSLTTQERVFIGSALAYMQKLGKEDGDFSIKALENIGYSDKLDEINKLREAIKDFYQNQAFLHLKTKMDLNIKNITDIFRGFIKENSDYTSLDSLNNADFNLILTMNNNAEKFLSISLAKLREEIKIDLIENSYFTDNIKIKIDSDFQLIDNDFIEQIRLESSTTSTSEFTPTKINVKVREKLHREAKVKFTKIAVNIADDKYKVILSKIVDVFLKAFNIEQNNPHYEELKVAFKTIIEDTTKNVSYDEKSFVHLIERFSVDIFDILLLYPFGSIDRKNKFLDCESDFYSLAMYYNQENRDETEPSFKQPLIDTILAHINSKELVKLEQTQDDIKDLLDKMNLSLDDDKLKSISLMVSKVKVNLSEFKDIVSEKIKEVDLTQPKSTIKIQLFKVLNSEMKQRISNIVTTKEFYINSLLENIKQAETKEQILEEINIDLTILKNILKEATLKAISLEKPFLSTINEQINSLLDILKSDLFVKFISQNAKKIKYFEFAQSEEQKSILESKKRLVTEIQNILNQMES